MFLTYQADLGHTRKEALIALAEVSRSTADRLVHKLGYRNYRNLQKAVRTDVGWGAPQLPYGGHAPDWSDVIEADQFNIAETFSTLPEGQLDTVADVLSAAPRVWVMGMRASAGLGEIATHSLGQVRRGVHGISGDSAAWSRDLAMIERGDALLVFAFRRRPEVLPRMLTEINRLGATTLLVTDVSAGSSARTATHAIRCSAKSPSPLVSFSAAFSILNALTLAVAQRMGDAGQKRMTDVDRMVRSIEAISTPLQRHRNNGGD